MLKMVLCIDAIHFDPAVLEFPAYLSPLTHARIVAAFLEQADENMMGRTEFFSPVVDAKAISERKEKIDHNIRLFREACDKIGLSAKVHPDRGIPAEEMIRESRYSDLLLLDAGALLLPDTETPPGRFAREILTRSECPVIILPEKFQPVEEILFACDWSASSIFAIKQFTYLFPYFADKKITVVYSKKTSEETTEDKMILLEWLNMHYSNAYYEETDENISLVLLSEYWKNQHFMTVMGSYGRGMISQLLRESHANKIIKMLSIPLFISHV